MSVYVTGDTHSEFLRFRKKSFPEGKNLTREDYMIICGDFGGVWCGEPRDAAGLDWLEQRPFTTLFVCGNHENYDELFRYPEEEWHGGRVHRIRPHVLHLMRGQVFELEGHSFFTMGGARSTDVWDGILDPEEPDFEKKFWLLRRRHGVFRVKHLSWWEQELPSEEEYAEARRNLARVGHAVDYILTHCAPSGIQDRLDNGAFQHDALTDFLEEVRLGTRFDAWFLGHYHRNETLERRFVLLYERIVKLL